MQKVPTGHSPCSPGRVAQAAGERTCGVPGASGRNAEKLGGVYHVEVWAGHLKAHGEVWEELGLGGEGSQVLFRPLPACTSRLGQTQMWQGVCVPLQVFPLGTHFLLRPGGRRITASSRGGLTLSLQPPSLLGPGLSLPPHHPVLGGGAVSSLPWPQTGPASNSSVSRCQGCQDVTSGRWASDQWTPSLSKDGGAGGRTGERPLMDGPGSSDGWAGRSYHLSWEVSGSREEEKGGRPQGWRVEGEPQGAGSQGWGRAGGRSS